MSTLDPWRRCYETACRRPLRMGHDLSSQGFQLHDAEKALCLYQCSFVAANCEEDCDAAAECRDEVGGTGCGYALQLWVDCEEEASLGCTQDDDACRPEQDAFEHCLRED